MERVRNVEQERDNVILSICIPSFNRGHRALEAVLQILNTMYDSEIEVIVSNNGSTENLEGYGKIKEIKDSRLVYHEFDENQGFIANICKVLSLARGKYAVLSSDEDKIIVKGLSYYFYLLRHVPDFGIVVSQFLGTNSRVREDGDLQSYNEIPPGIKAVYQSMDQRYMTGTIYNVDILKKEQVLEKVLSHTDNLYVQAYPHVFINMLMVYQHACGVGNALLFDCGKAEDNVLDENNVPSLLVFDGADNRIEQLKAQLELVCECMPYSLEELKEICTEICKHTLYLATISYHYYETYYKKKSWSYEYLLTYTRDVCVTETVNRIGGTVSDKEMHDIVEEIENCYQEYL